MTNLPDSQIEEATEYLVQFLQKQRLQRLKEVLNQRTRYITVVLEDIYQPHNASAVIRSCDGFGIQDLHIIENNHEFSVSKGVTIGSDKWITKYRYNDPPEAGPKNESNTINCLTSLKKHGYRIAAASPHQNDVLIYDLDVTKKTALLFGTELDGLSSQALEMSDLYVSIPMHGFSESFNISVSVAICLSHLSHKLRDQNFVWQLTDKEKKTLLFEWVKRSVNQPELLLKRFSENR